MDQLVTTALWRQFGASIDMLENALLACPDELWQERIWYEPEAPGYPVFWSITYHTLFWLDLYLTGLPEDEFAPPAPFGRTELDPSGAIAHPPYTREELRGYLKHLRERVQTTFTTMSDEKAHQQVSYPWGDGNSMSYFELQLYSLRHVHEHTAQLSLFLGQHGVDGRSLDWVAWASKKD